MFYRSADLGITNPAKGFKLVQPILPSLIFFFIYLSLLVSLRPICSIFTLLNVLFKHIEILYTGDVFQSFLYVLYLYKYKYTLLYEYKSSLSLSPSLTLTPVHITQKTMDFIMEFWFHRAKVLEVGQLAVKKAAFS